MFQLFDDESRQMSRQIPRGPSTNAHATRERPDSSRLKNVNLLSAQPRTRFASSFLKLYFVDRRYNPPYIVNFLKVNPQGNVSQAPLTLPNDNARYQFTHLPRKKQQGGKILLRNRTLGV